MTAAAVVALGLVGTFARLKAASGGIPTGLAVILGIFGLVGLGLAYVGIKGLVGLVRHGSWTLECRDGGGVFGEVLPVRILPAKPVTGGGEVKWTLTCIERAVHVHRRAGKAGTERRSDVRTLHQTSGTFRTGGITPEHGVQFDLPLPASGLSTQALSNGGSLTWQLSVVVPTDSGSHESVFELPIHQPAGAAASGRLPA
jgi:hypothetical protein